MLLQVVLAQHGDLKDASWKLASLLWDWGDVNLNSESTLCSWRNVYWVYFFWIWWVGSRLLYFIGQCIISLMFCIYDFNMCKTCLGRQNSSPYHATTRHEFLSGMNPRTSTKLTQHPFVFELKRRVHPRRRACCAGLWKPCRVDLDGEVSGSHRS